VIYLDTSAILKLLRDEPETGALRTHLETHAEQDLVTSALATVETARALIASGAAAIAASAVPGSDRIDLGDGAVIPAIAIIEPVLDLARTLPPAVLRSLDAIHIATARFAGDELHHVITYDKRMTAAAKAAGLSTASPS
jgi:uncharacterized protein